VDRSFEERVDCVAEYRLELANDVVKSARSSGHMIDNLFGFDRALMMGAFVETTPEVTARRAIFVAQKELSGGVSTAEFDAAIEAESWRTRWHDSAAGLSLRQWEQFCEFLDRHPVSVLRVADIARAVGLAESRFSQAFKATTGDTPYRFLLVVRLDRARRALLAAPTTKIANIASDFGFFDQSHFSRHFRKHFGRTPGELLESIDNRFSDNVRD